MDLKTNLMQNAPRDKKDMKFLYIAVAGILFIILSSMSLIIFFHFNRGIKLTGFKPVGEIDPKTNLTFTFSTDIAGSESIGDTFRGDFIKFSPDIPGKYRFISKRELCFLPEAPFRPSTKYKAEFKASLAGGKNTNAPTRLTGKRTVEFSTYRFKVENVNISFNYQAEQKKGIQLQARFNFNYPVSPGELQKFLKMRFADFGKEIQYNLNTNENSRQIMIISEPLYPGDKDLKIELSLPGGFHCVDGSLGLEKIYVATTNLSAKKDLGIQETTARTDSAKCRIFVRCSEPVDPEAVAGFIRLTPTVPFTVEADGEYFEIRSDQFKPRESYSVTLTSGLPALNGYPLKQDYTKKVIFDDLEPSLKFNHTGRYLSGKDNPSLSLETVNIEKVNLEISQILTGDIVGYFNSINGEENLNGNQVASFGKNVQSSVITINGAKNATIATPVNLDEVVSEKMKGFLQVVAYDNDNRWRQDSKYVIITDLGIVAKMSTAGLMIWVNSLETLKPKAKVKVSVISKSNQMMAAQYTDNQGITRFTQMKTNNAGLEPFIILAESDDDFAFIHLPSSRIAVSGFDTQGRNRLNEGDQAFLYMDREIFHPGDKGNLVAVVRNPHMVVPPDTQVKLEIRQPDGQIFKEIVGNTRSAGICEFAIPIPDYAPSGKYKVALIIADKIAGTTVFNVAEFMTERVKVVAITDKEEYMQGEIAHIKVEGSNLLGSPATGSKIKLNVKLEPEPFSPPDLNAYFFGDFSRSFVSTEEDLGEMKLDVNTAASYRYLFPKQITPPATLKATFQATMIEDGGRTISNDKIVTFYPYDCYIGIRPENESFSEIGRSNKIKYVVVDPWGKLIVKPLIRAEVYQITRNTVYRKNPDGHYSFHSEEEKEKVFSGAAEAIAGENSFRFTPTNSGRFLIVLSDAGGLGRSSYTFYVNDSRGGLGYSPWEMENPGKIQLDPEQKLYRVGDLARIRIKAPFPGKALITVERGKVYDYRIVEFKDNTGIVTIPVKEEYKPNVYVSVNLIRPLSATETNLPPRAFGVIPLVVDCSGRQLAVQIDSNSEVRPGRQMEVSIKVSNFHANDGYVTLAAVDESICRITNFVTPSPWEYFYGKRGLNVDSFDLYSMNLPESMENKVVSGRDTAQTGIEGKLHLNPVAIRGVIPVSRWSGLIKINRQGLAKVKINIPQFNGTLRLMAVISSGSSFGSAEKSVMVRDPIVMTPVFPSFAAPKDQFTVPVTVYNGTGQPGSFALRLFTGGPVEFLSPAELTVDLNNNTQKMIYFKLKAKNATGKLSFRLQAKGNDEICEVNAELPLRPALPLAHQIFSGAITSEKPLNLTLEHKLYPETAEYRLTLAPFPSVKYIGSFRYLWEYPYNSVEQITSRLFPLLYFNDLAQASHNEIFKGGNPKYFINQAVAKLESMQLADGDFAFWPGGNLSNEWSSVYTAHCLIEARKAGFKVSAPVYDRMVAFLQQIAKNNNKEKYHLQTKIYALYALSLAGKPLKSMMAYLKSNALLEMSDYSKAQLAAAYFYTGDRKTGQELLSVVTGTHPDAQFKEIRETGGNFNSSVRADAIMLGALADVTPADPAVQILMDRLTKEAKAGYWATTQENAFALIALSKVLGKKRTDGYRGAVIAGSTKIATFSSAKYLSIKDPRLSLGAVAIQITGGGECFYYLNVSGVSNQENTVPHNYDTGISVRRTLLNSRGEPINPEAIRLGDLLIAEITVQTKQDNLANIAVADQSAGGLEIEDPRLKRNTGLSWLDKDTINPDYREVRDDRLALFLSLPKAGVYKYYYRLRAVTCGEFTLPPISAGCMYDPEISSFASEGRIVITSNSK